MCYKNEKVQRSKSAIPHHCCIFIFQIRLECEPLFCMAMGNKTGISQLLRKMGGNLNISNYITLIGNYIIAEKLIRVLLSEKLFGFNSIYTYFKSKLLSKVSCTFYLLLHIHPLFYAQDNFPYFFSGKLNLRLFFF